MFAFIEWVVSLTFLRLLKYVYLNYSVFLTFYVLVHIWNLEEKCGYIKTRNPIPERRQKSEVKSTGG